MADRTLIKGGTVISVDPAIGDFFPTGDVLVEDERIVEVAAGIEAGRRGDRRDRLSRPAGPRRHASAHLAVALPEHRLRLDARALLHGPARDDERALPPGGHLRRQPARDAGGARLRDHDAARLVAQPQHARPLRRGRRRALRLGRPGDLRPRRRLPALAADQPDRASGRGRAAPPGEPLRLGRPARDDEPRPAGEPVRDDRGDAGRLGAREGARDPDQLSLRRRRMGPRPTDRQARGARAARRRR